MRRRRRRKSPTTHTTIERKEEEKTRYKNELPRYISSSACSKEGAERKGGEKKKYILYSNYFVFFPSFRGM